VKFFLEKIVVISGASSGLGLALAKQLAPWVKGLILLDLNPLSHEKQLEHFPEHHQKTWWRAVDVAVWDQLQIVASQHPFEHVDIVIANAGKGGVNPGNAFDVKMDHLIMSVNYFGTVHTLNAFLGTMLKRRSGHLVGIGSLASMRGLPNAASYSASKAAQLNLLESWRLDLRPFNIDVTTILPGFIRTPMTSHSEFEMPFMMNVDDCARDILQAIARKRKLYMLPWPMRFASLLNRIMPVWLYDFILPILNGRKVKAQAKLF
jgi:short-subunit dehydrogenase